MRFVDFAACSKKVHVVRTPARVSLVHECTEKPVMIELSLPEVLVLSCSWVIMTLRL